MATTPGDIFAVHDSILRLLGIDPKSRNITEFTVHCKYDNAAVITMKEMVLGCDETVEQKFHITPIVDPEPPKAVPITFNEIPIKYFLGGHDVSKFQPLTFTGHFDPAPPTDTSVGVEQPAGALVPNGGGGHSYFPFSADEWKAITVPGISVDEARAVCKLPPLPDSRGQVKLYPGVEWPDAECDMLATAPEAVSQAAISMCPDCCMGLTGWLPCEKHRTTDGE